MIVTTSSYDIALQFPFNQYVDEKSWVGRKERKEIISPILHYNFLFVNLSS